jgi:hypothetical protein
MWIVITTILLLPNPDEETDVWGPFDSSDDADDWIKLVQYKKYPQRTKFLIMKMSNPWTIMRTPSEYWKQAS